MRFLNLTLVALQFCSILSLQVIGFSEGHLEHLLNKYETLHSRDVITHHVKSRSPDLVSLFKTEKVISFNSFGRTFRLRLYPQEGIFSEDLFAAEVSDNHTRELFVNENNFYAGFLDGEPRILKAHAYWEEKNLVATIRTRNDTYYVEPSWRHLPDSDNYTMIVYRWSDVKKDSQQLDDQVAFCSPPSIDDTVVQNASRNFADSFPYYNLTGRPRVKRQSGQQHTVCAVMLVADYRFFNNVGQGSSTITANYMIGVLSRVNDIYRNTDFGGSSFQNLGFEVKGILINTAPTQVTSPAVHYNMETTSWDINALLNAFGATDQWQSYCLAHLFTYTSFSNGVLGLAWVASSQQGALGGICSPCVSGPQCYNTGWASSLNKYNSRLVTMQADLVSAHELGHGWGSQHDPATNECQPPSGGNFIMYAYSVSGNDGNNDHFSPCSRRTMGSILTVKKDTCFSAPSDSFCGNFVVEGNEQCDAGPAGTAGNDPCCDSQCMLRPSAVCSDANSECCRNCTYAPKTTNCSLSDDTASSCAAASFCAGDSLNCTKTNMADGTTCMNNTGHCVNGLCKGICEYNGLISCVCADVANSCFWCCQTSTNATCVPYTNSSTSSPKTVPDGYPCVQGYCQSGQCQLITATTGVRLWQIIQHLNVNNLALFMRNNLVLATIIITLIPYALLCVLICCKDYKKKQKDHQFKQWRCKSNDQLTLLADPPHIKSTDGIKIRPKHRAGEL